MERLESLKDFAFDYAESNGEVVDIFGLERQLTCTANEILVDREHDAIFTKKELVNLLNQFDDDQEIDPMCKDHYDVCGMLIYIRIGADSAHRELFVCLNLV